MLAGASALCDFVRIVKICEICVTRSRIFLLTDFTDSHRCKTFSPDKLCDSVTIQRMVSVTILSQEFENERIILSTGIKKNYEKEGSEAAYILQILINSLRCAENSIILKFLIKRK